MSLRHFSFPSHSTTEELVDLASRDASQSEPKTTDLIRESVTVPVISVSEVSFSEQAPSAGWSQPVEISQDDSSRLCRDAACQTEFECPMCNQALSRTEIAVESRSTQTAPETRSVFTRSSRFLSARHGCSDPAPPPDDPFTLARVSSKGDSTAVLSSRRVRGRFRGRGRGRGRGAAPANAVVQNASEQNQLNGGRGRQDRRAAGFDTLLALLESRLGEAAGRPPVQDGQPSTAAAAAAAAAAPPPPSSSSTGRATTLSNVTIPLDRQPEMGASNSSTDVAVQVVAYDGDSSSSSDTLFGVSAPKNQAPVFRTSSSRMAKLQQNLSARTKTTTTTTTTTNTSATSAAAPSTPADIRGSRFSSFPAASNIYESTNSSRDAVSGTHVKTSPPPHYPPLTALATPNQQKRDIPSTVASSLPIPTIADWITNINRGPTRIRRVGVRGFLDRLLGKESVATTLQRGQADVKNSSLAPANARNSNRSASSVAPIGRVKSPVLVAAGARTRSDSDSTR
ncbi:flocculation protein FLO11-like isoform X1 [Varroa destructor]|uniref:Uncharacterized protein n=1 Tax=Varroa destructor TaxID=109461 RepID=A0A7M7KEB5_VARDE|nr:flocculation protein FLO11-like isoform X1 [Varroa destructor]XP_022664942.1 flocculation protein FLO11-like isoform X1 [Varroa destructor]XP_022664943.1 flocculation protein FLO11-like isoform X1 [Varroa destructor]XP_022664944.1 flocculation protein FLO11-like isoform X1 [Varroa destructor]